MSKSDGALYFALHYPALLFRVCENGEKVKTNSAELPFFASFTPTIRSEAVSSSIALVEAISNVNHCLLFQILCCFQNSLSSFYTAQGALH